MLHDVIFIVIVNLCFLQRVLQFLDKEPAKWKRCLMSMYVYAREKTGNSGLYPFFLFLMHCHLKVLTHIKYKIPKDYLPQCNNQFSILLEPLMLSFNASVSTASFEDLYRSTLLWVEQHCSLVDLRPGSYTKETSKKIHLIIKHFLYF